MKRLRFALFILLALVSWTAFMGFGIQKGFILRGIASGEAPGDFVEAVETAVASEYVGNFAMALIEDGQIAGSHFFSSGEVVSSNTAFPVASISKWVTAYGIFRLIDEGLLNLDSPVDSYLSRWNLPAGDFDNGAVTVRRLLSHTAGLVDDLGYAGFKPGEPVQSLEESLTQASDAPWSEGVARVGIQPGSQYLYSGAGYALLQLVIEEVTQQSFQDFIAESVFNPLGMKRSTFAWADSTAWERATIFDGDGNPLPYKTFSAPSAAGLYTTVDDMAQFMAATISPSGGLRAETRESMFSPHAFVGKTGIHALGPTIFARDGKGTVIYGHDGSGDYINSAARINRETGDGIVIFETGHSNLASSLADHWIFWKTGIADFVVITANKNWLIFLLLFGYAVIVGLAMWRPTRRSRG